VSLAVTPTVTRFTCLIPAHDEAPRIGSVLAAVTGHPLIERVLVVDDGSRDGTAEVARASGAEVLVLPQNMGKTAALVQGIARVTTPGLVLIDADLVGLTAADVTRLVEPLRSGRAEVTVSLRGNAPLAWRAIGLDYLSGERAMPTALVGAHLDRMLRLPRFGFEVWLNGVILSAGLRLAVVAWPGVASPAKSVKRGFVAGIRGDIAMLGDILRTVPLPRVTAQILRMVARRELLGAERPIRRMARAMRELRAR
jgi:glycosyltransferase involved in cell wall biosynthesis